MLSMIKLLATDLDGTLFYPKRKLTLMTKSNIEFLKAFSKAGGKLVLVTGRSRRVSMRVKKKTGIDISVLGCNGSFIYKDDKFVKSTPIPKEYLLDIYMNLKANYNLFAIFLFDQEDSIKISPIGANKLTTHVSKWFNVFNFAYREKYVISEKEAIKSISNGKVYKIMPVFGILPNVRKRVLDASMALKKQYEDKLTIAAADIAIEITAKGVNKASTLLEYVESLGISKDEVAVAGDSYNDLPMFETFPNSFAMANGERIILENGKHIITRVSDISKYVLDENGNLKE
jgi:Cof subfamily protein (haloacid dehalogenase superfamily)